jgi:hypothetical protein
MQFTKADKLFFVVAILIACVALHYTPNASCIEHMGIACDINQGR